MINAVAILLMGFLSVPTAQSSVKTDLEISRTPASVQVRQAQPKRIARPKVNQGRVAYHRAVQSHRKRPAALRVEPHPSKLAQAPYSMPRLSLFAKTAAIPRGSESLRAQR